MIPKDHLIDLKRATLHERFKDMVITYNDKTSNGLTKMIIDFVNLTGGMAERTGNTGRWIDTSKIVTNVLGQKHKIGTGKYIKGSGLNGTSDLKIYVLGQIIAVEIKIGRDKQSEAQIKYQARIEAAGGQYWLIHNFDEFYNKYNLISIP